jgi:hypothetical protein
VKQRLLAGQEIDVFTAEEARAIIPDLLRDQLRNAQAETVRTGEQVKTDGTGAALLDEIYAVPLGQEFELRRVLIESDGTDPGHPFNAAAGWIDLLVDGRRVEFVSLAVGQGAIPFKLNWSSGQGPVLKNGQRLGALVAGGPANVNVTFSIQGVKIGPPAEG